MKTSRRRFVKMLSFGTATSIVAGKLWQRQIQAFCESAPDQQDAMLIVKVTDYPALQEDWGSVRLGINGVSGGQGRRI